MKIVDTGTNTVLLILTVLLVILFIFVSVLFGNCMTTVGISLKVLAIAGRLLQMASGVGILYGGLLVPEYISHRSETQKTNQQSDHLLEPRLLPRFALCVGGALVIGIVFESAGQFVRTNGLCLAETIF